MQNIVGVLKDDTRLTTWAAGETIQATEQCIAVSTGLTQRGSVAKVKCFVLDELVGKFFPVLKPLLQLCLDTR